MTPDFVSHIAGALRFKSYSELTEDLYLKAVVESFGRIEQVDGIGKLTENEIRNRLAFDLENHNTILKPFLDSKIIKLTKENTLLPTPTVTKRTDIEFFASIYGDFVLECKNLRSADQRYIDNGVSRFVTGYYSSRDSEAGMIGFVIGSTIHKITPSLLKKVTDMPSCNTTYVPSSQICSGHFYSFHTSHYRQNSSEILLHHLLIDLTTKC